MTQENISGGSDAEANADTDTGTDTGILAVGASSPPDRLSTNQRSPYFDLDVLQRGIGIRFKDRVRHDVEEYCISESWIRVAAGKSRDRYGQPLTIKLSGTVEAWFEDTGKE